MDPRGDGPFQVLKRINDNAYKIDLPGEYNVSSTFNVADLSPFDFSDSRSNLVEEGGNDTRSKARQMRSKLNGTIQEFVSKALDAYTKERENQDFKYWESWSKTPNLAAKAHWISITSINDSISVGDGSQAQILEGKAQ